MKLHVFFILLTPFIFISTSYASNNTTNGYDFINEANWIYKNLACADSNFNNVTTLKSTYCKKLNKLTRNYKKGFLSAANLFFSKHSPKNIPKQIVYSFGENDFFGALATYPNAEEIIVK